MKYIYPILIVIAQTSCGDQSRSVPHELLGTWLDDCTIFQSPISYREGLVFGYNSMHFVVLTYEDDSCDELSFIKKQEYNFEIESFGTEGNVDYQYESLSYTPYTTTGKEGLKLAYSQYDFQLNKETHVDIMAEVEKYVPEPMAENVYIELTSMKSLAYRIEDNTLFLGNESQSFIDRLTTTLKIGAYTKQ